MKSIDEARRGFKTTVDSRLQKEMLDLHGRIGGLQYDLKREREARHFWKFTAIVGLSYSVLLMAVIVDYLYL